MPGFKNFAEPVRALQEMWRVLKPGGRGAIIDLKRGASLKAINDCVNAMGLGVVDRFLTKLIFRTFLLKRAYSKEQFEQLGLQAGLGNVEIKEEGIGLEVSIRK